MSKVKTADYTPGKQLGWSGRALSLACNFIVVGYLQFYCTDMLMMAPALVGTLLLMSKIFDGFTDLVAGFIIDKTNTRWGKARPYELCIIGVWGCTVLLFSVPELGTVGKATWVFVMYTFVNSIFATMLNASESVYLARAFAEEQSRVKLVSINGVFCTFGAMVISIAFPQLMVSLGTSKGGWTIMVLICAVPLVLIGLGRFLLVKEINVNVEEQVEKIKIKEFLGALKVNPYIFLLMGTSLIVQIVTGMNTAVGTYYFRYIVGDVGMLSIMAMFGIITLPLILFFPMLMKRISASKLIIIGMAVGVIGYSLRFFAGDNITLLIAGNLIGGISALPISYLGAVMVIHCMDYSEWKTGKRVEGAFGSVISFGNKVGAGLASSLVGIIMGWAGYSKALEVQPDSAITSIVALYSLIPAVLLVLGIVLMRFYKLEKKLPQIHEELKEKNNKE